MIGEEKLSVDAMLEVDGSTEIKVAKEALERVRNAHKFVREVIERRRGEARHVYGLQSRLGHEVGQGTIEAAQLLVHHATGMAPERDEVLGRRALVVLLQGLCCGHSVVSEQLVMRLVELCNSNSFGEFDKEGSVGSADIIQLAQLVKPLVTEGFAFAFPGEALACISSNAVSCARALDIVGQLRVLVDRVSVAFALLAEGIVANLSPLRQCDEAGVKRLRHYFEGSSLWHDSARIQDALSIRGFGELMCVAQEELQSFEAALEEKMSSHQGNPFVDVEADSIYSVAKFDTTRLLVKLQSLAQAFKAVILSLDQVAQKSYDRRVSGLSSGLQSSPEDEDGVYSRCVGYWCLAAARGFVARACCDVYPFSSMSESVEDYSSVFPTVVSQYLDAIPFAFQVAACASLVGSTAVVRRGARLGPNLARAMEVFEPHVACLSESKPLDLGAVVADMMDM